MTTRMCGAGVGVRGVGKCAARVECLRERERPERGGRWDGDGGVRDMEEGEGWGGQAA